MLSILYVDDEPSLLDIGKLFLERSGSLCVDTAPSVNDAVSILREKKYDGIISDYQMPDTDGLEFLHYVRQNIGGVPFILFTGRGREEVVIEALNKGADYYLQKGGEPRSQFIELEHKIKLAVERRRIHKQLQDSERRLFDIINFLPDATFAIDSQGKVIAWNLALEELTGVKQEDILGRDRMEYSSIFYGENRPLLIDFILNNHPDIEQNYPAVHRKGDKLISEGHFGLSSQGKDIYVWLIASCLYDAQGNITGAIESIRDITERKRVEDEIRAAYEQLTATEEELRQQYNDLARSEEKIREDERYLNNILSSIRDGITVLDSNLTITRVNKIMNEMYHPDSSLIGRKCYEVYHHRDIPCEPCPVLTSFMTGEPSYDIHCSGSDNTPGWTELYSYPLKDSVTGEMNGVIEYVRDITGIKQNEEKVKKSEERYRGLLEISPDPMIFLDTNFKVLNANSKTLDLGGYAHFDEMNINGEIGFVAEKDREQVRNSISQLLRSGVCEKSEFLFIHKNDQSFTVECTWSSLLGEKREIVGIIGTLRDISETKRRHESIQQVNTKLHLMNTITRHDVLNKLTTLFMNLDLAIETCQDPEITYLLSNQKQAAEAIRQQISFTKEYQNFGIHSPQWQNLKKVINQAAINQDLNGVKLEVDIDGLEIFADDLLEKVFYNLIDNAIKYGEKITRITISYRESDDGIILFCEDDGVGIPYDLKEDIFTQQFYKNTGFGLLLTQKILSITGLSMKENGIPGKGSRFEILVPKDAFRFGAGKRDAISLSS